MDSPAQVAIDKLSQLSLERMIELANLLHIDTVRALCATSPELGQICTSEKFWSQRVLTDFILAAPKGLPAPLTYRQSYEMLESTHRLYISLNYISSFTIPRGQKSKHLLYPVPRFLVYRSNWLVPDVSIKPIPHTGFVCVALRLRPTVIGAFPPALYEGIVLASLKGLSESKLQPIRAQVNFFKSWAYDEIYVMDRERVQGLIQGAINLHYQELYFDDTRAPFAPIEESTVRDNSELFTVFD